MSKRYIAADFALIVRRTWIRVGDQIRNEGQFITKAFLKNFVVIHLKVVFSFR